MRLTFFSLWITCAALLFFQYGNCRSYNHINGLIEEISFDTRHELILENQNKVPGAQKKLKKKFKNKIRIEEGKNVTFLDSRNLIAEVDKFREGTYWRIANTKVKTIYRRESPDTNKIAHNDTLPILKNCFDISTVNREKFTRDATHILLKIIDKLPIKDSIIIPSKYLISIENALIAIHLSAEDSLRNKIENIHSTGDPIMDEFIMGLDTSYSWVRNLPNTHQIGNKKLNDFFNKHELYIDSRYFTVPEMNFFRNLHKDEISLIVNSKKFLNIDALCNYLQHEFREIKWAGPDFSTGYGDKIYIKYTNAFIDITYSHGWGDCPAGCIYKYRVWHDCKVEYLGE